MLSILRRNYLILIIIFLSLLPLYSLFTTSELIHTHDGLVHLPRIAAYFRALSDGHFPVRWAGYLNYGYGMPLFNFIYQVPYFISSIFIFLGAGLVGSFKITLALSYILSGIFMYMFAKAYFKDKRTAFFTTVLYQFAPFRFSELLMRASFGEVYTYAFLPLVLYAIVASVKTLSYRYFFLNAIATALLILSHNSISLVFFIVCLGFVIFNTRDIRKIFFVYTGLFLGLLISSFYWIPAIFEHKYTYGDLFMKDLYKEHFAPLNLFLMPNFNNIRLFRGLSLEIGIFHILGALIALVLIFKRTCNNLKRLFIYSFLVLFISIFFVLPSSRIFWENISLLRQFQFPWRFLASVVFATSMLGSSYFCLGILRKKLFFFLLCGLIIISTVFYWRPSFDYDRIDEKYYWDFPLNTTYYGETDVIWSKGPASSYPKSRAEIIGGKGKIVNYWNNSFFHLYTVQAENKVQIVQHTQYFPGWRVFIDGKEEKEVQFQDQNWRGEITFYVPSGEHEIKSVFGESKVRLFADVLSLGVFVTLLSGLFIQKRLNRIYKNERD